MNADSYLQEILKQQTLKEDSTEIKELIRHRNEVEALIVNEFANSSPTIDFGGSHAKGTMIRANFDIDIVSYFPHDDTEPGDSLKEIFKSVSELLSQNYTVREGTSALRLQSKDSIMLGRDFHIDVVPGRWVDSEGGDSYLHVNKGPKNWLKTNLRKHIDYVAKSKAISTIKLAKFWNYQAGLKIKTFVLELMVIDALNGTDELALGQAEAMKKFWLYLKDNRDTLRAEDPANPSGNDLSGLIEEIRYTICDAAEDALEHCSENDWRKIFGKLETDADVPRISILSSTANTYAQTAAKPWGVG